MASIQKLKPEQIVYTVVKRKMGNTSVSCGDLFKVKIIEIDLGKSKVYASCNGNPPVWYGEKSWRKWKVNKPEPKRMIFNTPSY